jgi:hypothetical protein
MKENIVTENSKTTPVIGFGSQNLCEILRIPRWLDNRLTDGIEFFNLKYGSRYTSQKYFFVSLHLLLNSISGWENFRAYWAEKISYIDKIHYFIGCRPCYFPTCIIVPPQLRSNVPSVK